MTAASVALPPPHHTRRTLRRAQLRGRGPRRPSAREAGDGVYVVRVCFGPPAQSTLLRSQVFVVEVDGRPARGFDDLPAAPASAAGALGSHMHIRTLDHYGKEGMQTLRPDGLFWPGAEFPREPDGGWARGDRSGIGSDGAPRP